MRADWAAVQRESSYSALFFSGTAAVRLGMGVMEGVTLGVMVTVGVREGIGVRV
jgi:hypothetical protein